MLTPAIIQPHLVPFLLEEFQQYVPRKRKDDDIELPPVEDPLHKKVLIVRSSTLGQVICQQLHDYKDHVYLILQAVPGGLSTHYYGFLCDKDEQVLDTTPAGSKMINDLIEDVMRTCLVFYVIGNLKGTEDDDVVQASIEQFMLRYDLYDFEFNIQQFRQMYYRSRKRNNLLHRFQNKPSPQKIKSLINVTPVLRGPA